MKTLKQLNMMMTANHDKYMADARENTFRLTGYSVIGGSKAPNPNPPSTVPSTPAPPPRKPTR